MLRQGIYSAILLAVLFLFYGGLYFLWTIQSPIYRGIMTVLGVPAWEFPFLDIIGVLSWGDMFGAVLLPFGIADFLGLPPIVGGVLFALALASFAFAVWRLVARFQSAVADADWHRSEFYLLAAGSVLCLGCFLAGASAGYRTVILLFVVPGLIALQKIPRQPAARIAAWTLGAVLFCLWEEFFRRGLIRIADTFLPALGDAPFVLFFLLRETVWWSTMAVLASFAVLFVAKSSAWQELKSFSGMTAARRH